MDFIKGIFNAIADPRAYFALMVVILCREPESWKTAAADDNRERR